MYVFNFLSMSKFHLLPRCFFAVATFRISIDLVSSLPSTVKLGYIVRRLQNLKKISFFDVYSVTSKQVGDFFNYFWPFQKTWTLQQRMVHVHKLCESGFPRVALTDSHNMFDGDRARQQPQSNQAVNLAHKVQSQGSLLLIYFHPKLERREGVIHFGSLDLQNLLFPFIFRGNVSLLENFDHGTNTANLELVFF